MVAEHSTILFSRNRLYHYQRTRPLTGCGRFAFPGILAKETSKMLKNLIPRFVAIVLPIVVLTLGIGAGIILDRQMGQGRQLLWV
jgi:hypothetical protein